MLLVLLVARAHNSYASTSDIAKAHVETTELVAYNVI